jgi:hypothetical protein
MRRPFRLFPLISLSGVGQRISIQIGKLSPQLQSLETVASYSHGKQRRTTTRSQKAEKEGA